MHFKGYGAFTVVAILWETINTECSKRDDLNEKRPNLNSPDLELLKSSNITVASDNIVIITVNTVI